MTLSMEPGDALLIVDVQNDFCPGGALAVPDGDAVVPVINRLIQSAQSAGRPVFASRDWHPANHVSFQEHGGPWPPHCIQETAGAAFHRDLALPEEAVIISKGTDPDREQYSAFDGTDLAQRLTEAEIGRIFVGGLAQEVCVRASVLDGLTAGFEVHLVAAATRPVEANPGDGERALAEMREAGAVVEEGAA